MFDSKHYLIDKITVLLLFVLLRRILTGAMLRLIGRSVATDHANTGQYERNGKRVSKNDAQVFHRTNLYSLYSLTKNLN